MRQLLLIGLAGLLLAPGLVLAQEEGADEADLVLAAREEGCPEERVYCFVPTQGDLSVLAPGATVTVTVVNGGNQRHNVFVAKSGDQDPEHKDTPASVAFAFSEDVLPLQESTFEVTVPEEGVYLWCKIEGHEQLGMWLHVPAEGEPDAFDPSVAQAAAGEEEDHDHTEHPHPEEENEAPVPLGILLAGLALAARRRD